MFYYLIVTFIPQYKFQTTFSKIIKIKEAYMSDNNEKENIDLKFIGQRLVESLYNRRKTVLIVALTSSLAYMVGYSCGEKHGEMKFNKIIHLSQQMDPKAYPYHSKHFHKYSNNNLKQKDFVTAEEAERKWGGEISQLQALQPADHNQHVIDHYKERQGYKKSHCSKQEKHMPYHKAEKMHEMMHRKNKELKCVGPWNQESLKPVPLPIYPAAIDEISKDHAKNGTYDIRDSKSYKQIMAKPLGPLDPESK